MYLWLWRSYGCHSPRIRRRASHTPAIAFFIFDLDTEVEHRPGYFGANLPADLVGPSLGRPDVYLDEGVLVPEHEVDGGSPGMCMSRGTEFQPKIMVWVLERDFCLTVARRVKVGAGWVGRGLTWTLQPSDRSVGATDSPRRPRNHVAHLAVRDDTYARLNRTGSFSLRLTPISRVSRSTPRASACL